MECDYIVGSSVAGMKTINPGGQVAIIRFYGVTEVDYYLIFIFILILILCCAK